MATTTQTPDVQWRPLEVSLWLAFVALSATLLQSLSSIWLHTFTLAADSAIPWSFWASVCIGLLAVSGMMGSLYAIDEARRAEA